MNIPCKNILSLNISLLQSSFLEVINSSTSRLFVDQKIDIHTQNTRQAIDLHVAHGRLNIGLTV